MTDREFLDAVDAALDAIEGRIERSGADIVAERSGNVLKLEFDDDSRMVINSQVALHELWVAARSGGYHLKFERGIWRDSRSNDELFDLLTRLVGEHAKEHIDLRSN